MAIEPSLCFWYCPISPEPLVFCPISSPSFENSIPAHGTTSSFPEILSWFAAFWIAVGEVLPAFSRTWAQAWTAVKALAEAPLKSTPARSL